jgi:quinol monooxygenase YgiN
MSNAAQPKAVTVIIRARLRDPATARQLHDRVTAATRDQAKAAGDLTHRVFLNPADPYAFLGIDEWRSADAVQSFASSPQIADFFGQLFEGAPDVSVWVPSDWNEW